MPTFPKYDRERNVVINSPSGNHRKPEKSVAALVLFGAGLGVVGDYLFAHNSTVSGTNAVAVNPSTEANDRFANPSPSIKGAEPNQIVAIAQQVGPAVVRIDSSGTIENPNALVNLCKETLVM